MPLLNPYKKVKRIAFGLTQAVLCSLVAGCLLVGCDSDPSTTSPQLDQDQTTRLLALALEDQEQFKQAIDALSVEQQVAAVKQLAELSVDQGKSFLLIERWQNRAAQKSLSHHSLSEQLLARVKADEDVDGRRAIEAYRVEKDFFYRRIARLYASNADRSWTGGALWVASKGCDWYFLTAAHNLLAGEGELRTELEKVHLELYNPGVGAVNLPIKRISSAISAASQEAKNDWLLLIAEGAYCDNDLPSEQLAELTLYANVGLPDKGLDVELICWHQRTNDIEPHLYRESCRAFNPKDALDHYQRQAGNLGVHGCFSVAGSSGCPLIHYAEGEPQLVGIQIEGDRLTGAGVGRLLTGELRTELEKLSKLTKASD